MTVIFQMWIIKKGARTRKVFLLMLNTDTLQSKTMQKAEWDFAGNLSLGLQKIKSENNFSKLSAQKLNVEKKNE